MRAIIPLIYSWHLLEFPLCYKCFLRRWKRQMYFTLALISFAILYTLQIHKMTSVHELSSNTKKGFSWHLFPRTEQTSLNLKAYLLELQWVGQEDLEQRKMTNRVHTKLFVYTALANKLDSCVVIQSMEVKGNNTLGSPLDLSTKCIVYLTNFIKNFT
jgi:hypothetical protein